MAVESFLPPVVTRLTMNIDDFAAKIETAKSMVKDFGDATIGVDVKGMAEAQAKLASLAKAQQAVVKVTTDGAASSAALATATTAGASAVGAAIPIWRRWFDLAHFGLAVFGQNLIVDTIGIAAFGASAVANLGPVAEAISNQGQTYVYLSNQQKAAADSTQALISKFEGANNTGVFAVFYGALDIINSRLGASGGIVAQATSAFERFTAMLQGTFSSPAWSGMLGRSGLIQQDLVALFRLFNQLIASIPALVHDFNFLGIGFLNGATGVLRLASAIAEADPFIYRLISGAYLLHRAWVYLWKGMGTGPGPLQAWATGAQAAIKKVTASWALAEATIGNESRIGNFVSLMFGGASLATLGTAAAGIAVVGAAIAAVVIASRNEVNSTNALIDRVQSMDQANKNSLPAWQQGLAMLQQAQTQADKTAESYRKMGDVVTYGRSGGLNPQGTSLRLSAALQQQSQAVLNLKGNLSGLERAYGLTGTQAVQVLTALSLDGTKAFGPQERQMIANYEQAVEAARNPLSAVQYGMAQAANTALQLDTRVTGLTNAFNAMLSPLNNVIGDTVTFSNDNQSLVSALQASSNRVGNNTALQRASAQAMTQSANDAMALSQAILQQTGSQQKAMGPLITLRNLLERMGAKGAWASQEIRALQQAINALQSKNVTINVRTLQSMVTVPGTTGSSYGPLRTGYVIPHNFRGFASGTAGAAPGWGWVGEAGPELVRFRGGESVIPSHVARGYANGTGGDIYVESVVQLDGKEVYRSMQKQAISTQRRTGTNGLVKRSR